MDEPDNAPSKATEHDSELQNQLNGSKMDKSKPEDNAASGHTDKEKLSSYGEESDKPVFVHTMKEDPSDSSTSPTKSPTDSPFKAPMTFKLPANLPAKKPAGESEKAKEPSKADNNSGTGKEEGNTDKGSKEKLEQESADNKDKKEAGSEKAGAKRKTPLDSLTPAQKKKYESIPMPYKEPSWSGIPEVPYQLEVLKMGKIVESIELNAKPFVVFGRLPTCDVPLEHPSLSRFHAVLQYRAADESPDAPDDRKKGFYLIDLGSTHGTFLNKSQVEANSFIRLKNGHMFKFGGSSRYFILQGGTADDEEAESEYTITQLKEMRKVREEHLRQKMAAEEEKERLEKERDAKGATWGFAEDAVEADDSDEDDGLIDMSKNPYSKMSGRPEHLDKYSDDPRKCLQNWYDREGEELEYEFVEEGTGKKKTYFCRLTLPVDSEEPVIAEGEGTNKKQAKIMAALEACKILDIRGLLFQSQQESQAQRRQKKLEENDFYDSDEDEFLDRTGEIEAKRQKRMAAVGKGSEEKAMTFADLTGKLDAIKDEIIDIERKLEKAKQDVAEKSAGSEDSLEAFMTAIKSGRSLDTKTRIKLKVRLQELKKEQLKVQKLADIARPANMPALAKPDQIVQRRGGIWVGKMGGRSRGGVVKAVQMMPKREEAEVVVEEEEEEEEDEEENKNGNEKKDPIKSKDISVEPSVTAPPSESQTAVASSTKESPSPKAESLKSTTSQTELGETKAAKRKLTSGAASDSASKAATGSVAAAIQSSGMERTERTLPKGPAHPGKRGPDVSVSAILSARMTESYNEEKMKDPKFAMWLPPKDQTGDGKTKLNEKFGY